MPVDPETAQVLWPAYFDASVTRAEGRRVPKALASDGPTAERVAKAVAALGLGCEIEAEKAYPSRWWRKEGRVLVERKLTKAELVRKVAEQLRRLPKAAPTEKAPQRS